MIDVKEVAEIVGRMIDDPEKSCFPNVAYKRVGAPEPSCNLKTILKIVYPEAGNLSKFAIFSMPHFPAFSKII